MELCHGIKPTCGPPNPTLGLGRPLGTTSRRRIERESNRTPTQHAHHTAHSIQHSVSIQHSAFSTHSRHSAPPHATELPHAAITYSLCRTDGYVKWCGRSYSKDLSKDGDRAGDAHCTYCTQYPYYTQHAYCTQHAYSTWHTAYIQHTVYIPHTHTTCTSYSTQHTAHSTHHSAFSQHSTFIQHSAYIAHIAHIVHLPMLRSSPRPGSVGTQVAHRAVWKPFQSATSSAIAHLRFPVSAFFFFV